MARKKKKSRSSLLIWLIISVVSGGGFSGYMKPDLPIIGPIIAKLMGRNGSDPNLSREQLVGDMLQSHPMAANAVDRMTGEGAMRSDINGGQPGVQLASSRRPPDSILIASFNIQVLGESKMSKPRVVEILAHAIRNSTLWRSKKTVRRATRFCPDSSLR